MARIYKREDISNLDDSDDDNSEPKANNIYIGDPNLYAVERIVKRRTRKRKVEYLLKWKGYSDADNSWEDRLNVSQDLIDSFESERKSISAKKVTKKLKRQHDETSSVEYNRTFEVPAESTSQDAPHETMKVLEKTLSPAKKVCYEVPYDALKVMTRMPNEDPLLNKICDEIPSDTFDSVSLQVVNVPLINSPEEEQNEWLDETLTEGPEKLEIKSMKNLGHKTFSGSLRALSQVSNDVLMDVVEHEPHEWAKSMIEPQKFEIQPLPKMSCEVPNDMLNSVSMQVLNGALMNSPEEKGNEWLRKTSTEGFAKVQNKSMDLYNEVPSTALNATFMQLPHDKPEDEQNEWSKETNGPVQILSSKKLFDKIHNDAVNDVFDASSLTVMNKSLITSSEKERNELSFAEKGSEKVSGQGLTEVGCEIPNDELKKVPIAEALMEIAINLQNQIMSSKGQKYYRSPAKIQSPKKLPYLRTSNRTVPVKITEAHTNTTTSEGKLMESGYLSDDENERDLIGYDGSQPLYD